MTAKQEHDALAAIHAQAKADKAKAHQSAVAAKQQKHNEALQAKETKHNALKLQHQQAHDARLAAKLLKKQGGNIPLQPNGTPNPNTSPSGDQSQSNLTPGGANGDVSGTGGTTSGVLDPGQSLYTDATPANVAIQPGFWGNLSGTDKTLIIVGVLIVGVVVFTIATNKSKEKTGVAKLIEEVKGLL